MNIVLNKDNVGIFLNTEVTLTENGVMFEDGGINTEYTTDNASSIEAIQPNPPVDFAWKWNGTDWEVFDQQKIDAYVLDKNIAFNKKQAELRAKAYPIESDPLFFKAQRGEANIDEWEAKVAEIKGKYPYIDTV